MAYEHLLDELKPERIPLDQIYLDPNNPRFTATGWVFVPDEEILLEATQDAARQRLVREFGVGKLRINMEVNGFPPINQVVVRELGKEKFVVLEGNRRICAAQLIGPHDADGVGINERVRESLQEITCLVYTGEDQEASWIIQGLRHITGLLDWSSYNKARLLVEQMEADDLTLGEIGRRFGLTAHGAGQWMRGYFTFRQAREKSDYVQEVDERV